MAHIKAFYMTLKVPYDVTIETRNIWLWVIPSTGADPGF